MKQHDLSAEELRAEYHRPDLGKLVRGKYASRFAKASNVVVVDQALTKAFPNSDAVNAALRGLLQLATAAVKPRPAAKKSSPRKAAA